MEIPNHLLQITPDDNLYQIEFINKEKEVTKGYILLDSKYFIGLLSLKEKENQYQYIYGEYIEGYMVSLYVDGKNIGTFYYNEKLTAINNPKIIFGNLTEHGNGEIYLTHKELKNKPDHFKILTSLIILYFGAEVKLNEQMGEHFLQFCNKFNIPNKLGRVSKG